MADKAGSSLSRFLGRLGIKSPWKVRVVCVCQWRRARDASFSFFLRRLTARRSSARPAQPPCDPALPPSPPVPHATLKRPDTSGPAARHVDTTILTHPFLQHTKQQQTLNHNQVTGVASSPEFASYLPAATEYRKHAPASPPTRPSIPHARPERVYDIKYWTRDTRRAGQVVGGTNKLHIVVSAVDPAVPDPALENGPAVPGKPYKWSSRSPLLDAPNNGYTV
jgi:hypothetical protein